MSPQPVPFLPGDRTEGALLGYEQIHPRLYEAIREAAYTGYWTEAKLDGVPVTMRDVYLARYVYADGGACLSWWVPDYVNRAFTVALDAVRGSVPRPYDVARYAAERVRTCPDMCEIIDATHRLGGASAVYTLLVGYPPLDLWGDPSTAPGAFRPEHP